MRAEQLLIRGSHVPEATFILSRQVRDAVTGRDEGRDVCLGLLRNSRRLILNDGTTVHIQEFKGQRLKRASHNVHAAAL